mmetsp:Transcript_112950/g.364647  ORF Transcript_112950/g.364647 Transcript_112950/m.364647 type:complete len:222 (-) Transcript_112950:154-819(-)
MDPVSDALQLLNLGTRGEPWERCAPQALALAHHDAALLRVTAHDDPGLEGRRWWRGRILLLRGGHACGWLVLLRGWLKLWGWLHLCAVRGRQRFLFGRGRGLDLLHGGLLLRRRRGLRSGWLLSLCWLPSLGRLLGGLLRRSRLLEGRRSGRRQVWLELPGRGLAASSPRCNGLRGGRGLGRSGHRRLLGLAAEDRRRGRRVVRHRLLRPCRCRLRLRGSR